MKMLRMHISLAVVILAAVQAQAGVILSTDFTGSTATPDADPLVIGSVSGITWITDGLTDPGAVTVDVINSSGGNTFWTTPQATGIAVDNNVGNGGSWAADVVCDVLTNANLIYPNWGVLQTGTSPITNAISDEAQLFYKLELND
ncbi:hypothetical protein P4C99_20815 [Pontiellaceae bacterium B1224]|nr:hypothetical protein [Pontiellaceae bacterium B1224]